MLLSAKRGDQMLTERQVLILESIIRFYTETGHPVGSKTLMNELSLPFSSATIRNEMSRLEELGFIEKTHSSSGRIPSVKGYRFYVDYLISPEQLPAQEVAKIRSAFGPRYHELDEIVSQSANILSELTNYTAILLGPKMQENKLTGFRLVPLSEHQAMAILVTDQAHVENRTFTIPPGMKLADLETIVKIFNDQLIGLPLTEVFKKINVEIPQILARHLHTDSDLFVDVFGNIITHTIRERFYVGGKMNLLNFSEFQDIEKFKSIYSLMDEGNNLRTLISRKSDGIHVKIGQELNNDLFSDFSLITATYQVVGHGEGMIALLGPTSMPYSKMLGLVDTFRNELADKVSDYYRFLEE